MSKLIKCNSCGKEVANTAKSCPGCGAKVKKPIYKRVWFWVIIVFVVIGLASGGSGKSSESSSSNNNEKTPTTKKEDLVLEDGHTGSPDEYGFAYYIEGYIKNNTDKEYSYVQVEFTAYDAEGNIVGSCLDNNSGLDANGRWKFKAICSGEAEQIASYKFKKITKW